MKQRYRLIKEATSYKDLYRYKIQRLKFGIWWTARESYYLSEATDIYTEMLSKANKHNDSTNGSEVLFDNGLPRPNKTVVTEMPE